MYIFTPKLRHVPFSVPHLSKKGCSGLFVASLIACLFIFLVVTGVTVNGIIGKMGVGDVCQENRCLFKDPSLPVDITCVTDVDCSAWVHPCLVGHCSEEGTERCVYTQAGLFECICKESFSGQTCRNHMEEEEEDQCSLCLNNGTCLETQVGNEYLCLCTDGWDGDHCQQRRIVAFNNSSLQCDMSMNQSDWELIGNQIQWHELARTDLSYLPIDGCVTYDFTTGDNSTIHVNVTSVPLSKFTEQRQGVISLSMTLHGNENDSLLYVNDSQPFIHTSKSDDLISVAIYSIEPAVLAMHMCFTDPLFGKQEFVTVLSQSKVLENVDSVLDNVRGQLNSNMTFVETENNLPSC